jgi:hypothetical protein
MVNDALARRDAVADLRREPVPVAHGHLAAPGAVVVDDKLPVLVSLAQGASK